MAKQPWMSWHEVVTLRDDLKSGELPPRSPTPVLKLSGPTSMEREYATQTIALERVKARPRLPSGSRTA